jgi:hypothetical protein
LSNTISAFFQTLANTAQEAAQVLSPSWGLLQSIYYDFRPEPAAIGQTVNVALPADPATQVVDGGAGDISLTDISFTTKAITLSSHPYFAYVVRDFEQFNSPEMIRQVFLDAALKAIHTYLNLQVVRLITTTNFPTNTTSAGTLPFNAGGVFYAAVGAAGATGAGKGLGITEFTTVLQNQLMKLNVPVMDPKNMSLVCHPDLYNKLKDPSTTLGATAPKFDPAWTQAFISGNRRAEQVRDSGILEQAEGTVIRFDQQMPATATVATNVYMHRWAIAMISRPLPAPDGKVVDYRYIMAGPQHSNYPELAPNAMRLPIRLMMGYNQYPKLGHIVSLDCGYGLAVMRENMCIPFTNTLGV